MTEPRSPLEPTLPESEPASMAEVARVLVVALATVGVLNFDTATLSAITAVVGMLLSIALTWWTRTRVTPIAVPRSSSGKPLTTPPRRPQPPGSS